jgi:hypothetical protein
LHFYGSPTDAEPMDWADVDEALQAAGTYWVVARSAGHPHPRPVWGLWDGSILHLSIGGPVLVRDLATDPTVTVHLDSGTEVVIVEGRAIDQRADPAVIGRYEAKYDRGYDVQEYGPLTVVEPAQVLAWRAGGPAGRDGFQAAGRWTFER